jgi:heterodisulfide reductase subunit A-like polyferredoxin
MIFSNTPRPETLKSLADVKLTPFWLDDPNKPEPAPALTENIQADLVVVGAGFTGLWTALIAKQADPARNVVLVEAGEVGIGASGRNGGFMAASLTHTFQNGLNRWPDSILIATSSAQARSMSQTKNIKSMNCARKRKNPQGMASKFNFWIKNKCARESTRRPIWPRSMTLLWRWSTPRSWRGD